MDSGYTCQEANVARIKTGLLKTEFSTRNYLGFVVNQSVLNTEILAL